MLPEIKVSGAQARCNRNHAEIAASRAPARTSGIRHSANTAQMAMATVSAASKRSRPGWADQERISKPDHKRPKEHGSQVEKGAPDSAVPHAGREAAKCQPRNQVNDVMLSG